MRREILRGRPWFGHPQIVVEDSDELLVAFTPPNAPFDFPSGAWPSPSGRHPWHGRAGWEGHGTLHVMRPEEPLAIWLFWEGPQRRFTGWYVNIQEPFRRTAIGYDTQDLELDIVLEVDGNWHFKDLAAIDDRLVEGRFTPAQAVAIRRIGGHVADELRAGRRWWDPGWASWQPDTTWTTPQLPRGWADVPAPQAPQLKS